MEAEFRGQKERVDVLSKNDVHSTIKLDEAGSHLALMHQKVNIACQMEAQVISNAKAKIAELERNF